MRPFKDKTPSKELLPKTYNKKTVFINIDPNLALYLADNYLKLNKKWVKTKHQYNRDIAFAFYYPYLMKIGRESVRKYLLNNGFMVHDLTDYEPFSQMDQFISYDNVVLGELTTLRDNFYSLELYYFFLEGIQQILKNGNRIFYFANEYNFDPTLDCTYNAESLSNSTALIRYYEVSAFMDKLFSYMRSYDKKPIHRIMLPYYLNIFNDNNDYFRLDDVPLLVRDISYYDHPKWDKVSKQLFETRFSFMSTDKIADILYEMFFINDSLESKNYLIDSKFKSSLSELRFRNKHTPPLYHLKVKSNYETQIVNHSDEEYHNQLKYIIKKYKLNLRKQNLKFD